MTPDIKAIIDRLGLIPSEEFQEFADELIDELANIVAECSDDSEAPDLYQLVLTKINEKFRSK